MIFLELLIPSSQDEVWLACWVKNYNRFSVQPLKVLSVSIMNSWQKSTQMVVTDISMKIISSDINLFFPALNQRSARREFKGMFHFASHQLSGCKYNLTMRRTKRRKTGRRTQFEWEIVQRCIWRHKMTDSTEVSSSRRAFSPMFSCWTSSLPFLHETFLYC